MRVFIAANMMWFTAAFFASIFQCVPIAKTWNNTISGRCIAYSAYIVVVGVGNLVSDVIMLAMPIFWIMKLHISLKRRIGAAGILAVGLLYDSQVVLCCHRSQELT